jgi:hypothetical protein
MGKRREFFGNLIHQKSEIRVQLLRDLCARLFHCIVNMLPSYWASCEISEYKDYIPCDRTLLKMPVNYTQIIKLLMYFSSITNSTTGPIFT